MAMAECVGPSSHHSRTGLIVKRVFFKLLSDCNTERDVLTSFNVDLDSLSEADAKLVQEASDKTVELLHRKEEAGVVYNVKDFTEQEWDIHSGNMYSEYRRVVHETVKRKGSMHYGRLLAFFGFTVAYGVYVRGRGIEQALPSVEAWTVQVIEEDVGTYFKDNDGWNGFISYCDVLLRARRQNGHSEPSYWQAATAVGAIGIGALATLMLRNAFS